MKFNNVIAYFFVCMINLSLKAQNDSKPKKKYLLDTRFTMLVDARTAVEFESGDVQKTEFFIRPEIDILVSKNLRLKMIGRVYTELLDNLEPGIPTQNAVSEFSNRAFIGDRLEAELREFYVDWKIGKHFLTLGKQQIVWGKADGLKILDIVNPTNFREFLLDNFDNSRIPLWSVKADIKLSKVKAQFIWVPDITYHDFPTQKAPFFPKALFSSVPQGVSVSNKPMEKPKKPIKDADYGLRLSAFLNGWDITVNYLYQYDNFPVAKTMVDKLNNTMSITPLFKRYHLFGGTFSNAFGSYTLRGELGYSKDKYFSSDNTNISEGIFKSDQIMGVIGVDYSGISNSTLSFQIFEDYIFNNQMASGRQGSETNVSFLVDRRFANETLTASIICVQNLNKCDGFVRPKIEYLVLNNLTAFLGADLFYGDKNRLFGQFKSLNRLSMGLQLGI
ncbi:hypothetical protein Q4Q39_02480 [Flavivirga amylovorans]|uniref:Capsule assembly Wzi family protein n=1 Tax=Flavivirga amylovorans TaxID=870486 RepID=A0ABT8WY38_9FLAO|nr:DUF1302 family protein [Flavivirga amylovorans]MDO5986260.1 hypothetical protein [Flavivirga amylovorans]